MQTIVLATQKGGSGKSTLAIGLARAAIQVGHTVRLIETDTQGTLAGNLDLSQRRAEAVVRALEAQHKVDPKRLVAKGVASLAPVATNDSDAGRERNRRVELVKQ